VYPSVGKGDTIEKLAVCPVPDVWILLHMFVQVQVVDSFRSASRVEVPIGMAEDTETDTE
jgi:hypothetical protein